MYKIHQPHDKIFKIVLNEKNQVVGLLNRILQLDNKLGDNEITKYNNEHINYMFQSTQSDIVYKMNEKQIFFLIEHQTKIDYDMPRRLLEYQVEIIKEAVAGKKMTKANHILPRVIPIVIYTGTGKWNVEKYIGECQEVLSKEKDIKVGEYYVVDANDYSNKQLENDKLFLSKIMLLEKLKTKEEIGVMLDKIIKEEKEKKNLEILKRIIVFVLSDKLNKEKKEELLKKLESEEKSMMVEVLSREFRKERREGKREGKREGIKEGIKSVAIKMLKMGLQEDLICNATNIKKEELEKIKNSKK